MTNISDVPAVDDALFGVVISPRIERIIQLERQADDAQWEAARLIFEELADGKSQRQLAREIGKSHTHVHFMAKCWHLRGYYSNRSSFSEFYNSPAIRAAGQESAELPQGEPLPLGHADADEDRPEDDHPICEACGGLIPSDDWFEGYALCRDCDTERAAAYGPGSDAELDDEPLAPQRRPASHTAQPTPEQRENLDRMRQMADRAERENPPVPIRELLDLQGALQRVIPKMRALKDAGQDAGADALTARLSDLLKEMEKLL